VFHIFKDQEAYTNTHDAWLSWYLVEDNNFFEDQGTLPDAIHTGVPKYTNSEFTRNDDVLPVPNTLTVSAGDFVSYPMAMDELKYSPVIGELLMFDFNPNSNKLNTDDGNFFSFTDPAIDSLDQKLFQMEVIDETQAVNRVYPIMNYYNPSGQGQYNDYWTPDGSSKTVGNSLTVGSRFIFNWHRADEVPRNDIETRCSVKVKIDNTGSILKVDSKDI